MTTPTITPPSTELTQELEQITEVVPEREPAGGPFLEQLPVLRLCVTVGCTILAAAIMTGGIFIGVGPRIYAALAGFVGIALGARATRIRRPALLYAWIVGGVFLTGLIFVIPSGFGNVVRIGDEVRRAALQGDLHLPPVEFLPGWRAVLAWIMCSFGFTAAWFAIELRRPALGLIAPLPLLAIAAISVPESQQKVSGLVALVLFAVALGVLSGTQQRGEDDQPVSMAYEARRAIRALPLIGGVTVALYVLSSSNLLFPAPLYDPAQEARIPRSIPLQEVQDRVLFTVRADFTGPWKMGILSVYDGTDWRLPPFAQSNIGEVPRSGIVEGRLEPGVSAVFTLQGITGAVLPSLPNTVGIIAEGPKLAYDKTTGNIRLSQGDLRAGLSYTVVAAAVPQIERLRSALPTPEKGFDIYLETKGPPPPAVADLLRKAPKDSPWDTLDHMRQTLLRTVVSSGPGSPRSVPASKVQDLLAGSRQGTPFEIVAAQALLARWAGVPSRIGYGFDGGEPGPGGVLQVRPKHGSVYLEVYFQGFGWLPIIGDPLQAQESFSDSPTQFNPNVLISDDVSVGLYLPLATQPASELFRQIRRIVFTVLPVVVALFLIYYLWPLPYKSFRRARRRSHAADLGAAGRVALAYAEWRDHCTDYGYRHYTDTPLMFLERVVPDAEHAEFAWLVTRVLWGDLQSEATIDHALAAEELAVSLRRRLSQAQSVTLRFVAALSRLSLRHPYTTRFDHEYREASVAA